MERRRILVIENDKSLKEWFAIALRDHGYAVSTATSVGEAEALIEKLGPAAIGLVISETHLSRDWREPDGYALYQRWRMAHPATPYLLIRGNRINAPTPPARDGATAFLSKPFGVDELIDAVQALLSGGLEGGAACM